MKWFKHDTDASIDAKLQELLLDYGAAGYGLYWYCVELIAKDVSPSNITFELEHDARVIARNLNLSVQETKDMMQKMVDLGLFDITINKKIACVKIAYRLDDSMRKGRQVEEIINKFNESGKVGKIPDDSGKSLLDIDKDIDIDIEVDTDKDTEEKYKKENSQKKPDELPTPRKKSIPDYLSGVTEQTYSDFKELRKAKRAPITERAIQGIRNEADKAGISLEKALIECCVRGWQSFKADWYVNSNQSKQNGKVVEFNRDEYNKRQTEIARQRLFGIQNNEERDITDESKAL